MHYHRDVLAICDTYCDAACCSRAATISSAEARRWRLRSASGGLLLFPLHAGAATLMLEKAGPIELLEAIAAFGVTTIFTAPVAYRTMAAKAMEYDLTTLRTCVSAGETLPKAVWEQWRATTGLEDSRRDRQHRDAPHFRRFAAA